jgi:hypothetical protein
MVYPALECISSLHPKSSNENFRMYISLCVFVQFHEKTTFLMVDVKKDKTGLTKSFIFSTNIF